MMARKPSWRSIKRLHSYRLEEAATLLGVHIRTIRNWIKRDGLEVMKAERPHLIRGDVLIAFLQQRKQAGRHPLGACQFYCLKCRAAREAAEGMVDCTLIGDTKSTLTALCGVCQTVMHRHISRAQLSTVSLNLDVTITQGPMRLRRCA